jgi:hypothetical protein
MGCAGPVVHLAHSGPKILGFGFLGRVALSWAASFGKDAFSRAAALFYPPPSASASSVFTGAEVVAVVPAALEMPAVTPPFP